MEKEIRKLFEQGCSNREISEKLNLSLSMVKRKIHSLGLVRTREQKRQIQSHAISRAYEKGTLKRLAGDNNPAKRPEVRKKISESLKKSSRAKSGRAKAKKTMLEIYGVDNAFKSPEIKQKIRATNLERYGAELPLQNREIAEKMSKKMKESKRRKYGWLERKASLEKLYEKNGKVHPKELEKVWGLSESNIYKFIRGQNLESLVKLKTSWLEDSIEIFLKENGITFIKHDRKTIAPQELDFFIPEFNLAIEANDVFTHNSTLNSFGGEPKDRKYHFNKSLACEKRGVRLIHIWDYEWFNPQKKQILESMILGACNKAATIFARKCTVEIRKSCEMRDFFEKNNIAGFRGGKFAICLVYNGEVVMSYLMGFSYLARGQQELEVIRGATKLNTRVVGGASRLWKHLLREYKPKSVVYYIDYNYFNGNSLPYLGLEFVKAQPGVKNYFVSERVVKNRQPSKNKEIRELVEQGKVWEIWNAGVKKYIWNAPETSLPT